MPNRPPRALWLLLYGLALGEMAHQLFGFGGTGTDRLFNAWIHDGLMFATAGLCLLRAAAERRGRRAWLAFGLAFLAYAVGETLSTFVYDDRDPFPFPSVADAFWLAWFPLAIAGLVALVRERVPRFELHRWIDGLAIVLIVATPGVALVLEPALDESSQSTFAKVITITYPAGDMLIVGAVIGVFALVAWRVSRAWVLLGLGLLMLALADSVYSAQNLADTYQTGVYDFFWSMGALTVGLAAWQPSEGRLPAVEPVGWRAIALPLACQATAAAIQVYAYFHHVPESERILTIAVLFIAMVQIVVSRPRLLARPAEGALSADA